jgi:hypothetical protein
VHNTDEITTLEPMASISPLAYFGFEDRGLIWGFSLHTAGRIFAQSVTPENPYTRVPLSYDTRRRLRIYLHTTPANPEIAITQIVHENGFQDFHSEFLSCLTNDQAVVLRNLLLYDLRALPEPIWKPMCARLQSTSFMVGAPAREVYMAMILSCFRQLRSPTQEYMLCFVLMSTLVRL